MKNNTQRDAGRLRHIASIILTVGILLGITVLVFGILAMGSKAVLSADNARKYTFTARTLYLSLSSFGGIGLVIISLLIMWVSYVSFASIMAHATLIENCDRSDVVGALKAINETLVGLKEDSTMRATEKAVEAVAKAQEAMVKEELEK